MNEGPGALREENGKSSLDRRGGENDSQQNHQEIGFATLVSHHREEI
jgi:hypothetical protein